MGKKYRRRNEEGEGEGIWRKASVRMAGVSGDTRASDPHAPDPTLLNPILISPVSLPRAFPSPLSISPFPHYPILQFFSIKAKQGFSIFYY